ncbi:threonine dehydrogenase-like Zn-dependent dehydrogenase [Antricoccus suffuscus]|uniref:Threonine dehydrogenase-like Zn-dependent dehydrogenase n=1 Tax=Antricoccus suffuscus TaxID=1629062 RepID=A0A2T1A5J7_9ACTN|nr:alcohol dehydrogenase catalytic domain-containing protein [Antricoccus suffuscus]PRZ43882.1 threonine dehydrogenase-like Zn-dependent dehydrogenase [Antricoccus suffuscus]
MRATVMYGAGDVRIEHVPDASIDAPTDAVVRVTGAAICGSDLWPYGSKPADSAPQRMGHEFIGVVEDLGSAITTLQRGDLVISPFLWQDNTCDYCRRGLTSSCRHGGGYGHANDGGQGEAVRVPQAAGTLVKLNVAPDSSLMPSLLTLTDVFCTGHHAAVCGHVGNGSTVAVVGDGAVGLSAVLAARRLGAERIILIGRHTVRTDVGREFGATDVVTERGSEATALVRDLTGGNGVDAVLECVGHADALETAFGAVRDGGYVSRVGVPQYTEGPIGMDMIARNLTLTGGVAPARAYLEQLLPDVLDGTIEPGKVFDRTVDLAGVPAGYQAMADRQALKVAVTP